MNSTNYPKISEKIKISHPKGLCHFCNQPKADTKIIMEVDIFRGNDRVYKVHSECIKNFSDKILVQKIIGLNTWN